MTLAERPRVEASLREALSFAGLDDASLGRLAEASVNRSYRGGDVIFEKGSPADGLYVVLSGAVRIFDSIRGRDAEVAAIGPGDFFGELSLALHTGRTRAAQAREDSEIAVVPLEAFQEVTASHPEIERRLVEAFEDRMVAREDMARGDRGEA